MKILKIILSLFLLTQVQQSFAASKGGAPKKRPCISKEERAKRNRASALKSRKKKKQELADVNAKSERFEAENIDLREKLACAELIISQLEERVALLERDNELLMIDFQGSLGRTNSSAMSFLDSPVSPASQIFQEGTQ